MAIDTDELPELLNWYEGMLLMPWHFQQSNRRQEVLSSWLAQVASPHGWGVRSLKSSLSNGKFQVDEVEAVLPDRLVVSHQNADETTRLQIDLTDKLTEDMPRVCVHLAAVRWNPEALGRGPQARYLPAASSAPGATMPTWWPTTPTPAVRPRGCGPSCNCSGPPVRWTSCLAGYVSLPLACFVRREGSIEHSPYQPPPSLSLATPLHREGEVRAPALLLEHAQAVRGELLAKAAFLNERLASTQALAAPTAAAMTTPRLAAPPSTGDVRPASPEVLDGTATTPTAEGDRQHLAEIKDAHRGRDVASPPDLVPAPDAQRPQRPDPDPAAAQRTHLGPRHAPQAAFLALCDILGDLSVLGGYRLPEALPIYEHLDARASFEAVLHLIRPILEKLNQKYQALPFERTTSGSTTRFVLKARPDVTNNTFILCAFPGPGRTSTMISRWMENALIATEGARRRA